MYVPKLLSLKIIKWLLIDQETFTTLSESNRNEQKSNYNVNELNQQSLFECIIQSTVPVAGKHSHAQISFSS